MTAEEKLKEIEADLPNIVMEEIDWLIARVKKLTEQGNYLDSALSGMLECEEVECRGDEDCDHCFAVQAQKEWTQALEDESCTESEHPNHLLGIAGEKLKEGDLVTIDPKTGLIMRSVSK